MSLLSAILVGGAIGCVGVLVFILRVASGAPEVPAGARPTAIVITVTPTPRLPTPTPPPLPTALPTPDRLVTGGYARVSGTDGDALRLRSDPGLQTTTLTTIPEGAVLLILDGPRDADGIAWWRLRSLADGAEGWAAQLYLVPSGEP